METLIRALFPAGSGRSGALTRFDQLVRKVNGSSPNTDPLQTQALRLVDFILNKYYEGVLVGGTSPATQANVITLLNAVLCTAGLPQTFGPGSLSGDAAAAVIYPTSPDTTVVTGTQFAGVYVPSGSVTEPALVQINRLPDSPWPLLTPLDQYPLFYEYTVTPYMPFQFDLTVGVCVVGTPPDPGRLRLAHNVPHANPTGIEILPLAFAPFVDCTNADISMTGSGRWSQLARGGLRLVESAFAVLAPRPLYAAPFYAGAGLGGTVRTFSAFGAVDTLALMTSASPLEQHTSGDIIPPAVLLSTPTGRTMQGVSVLFEIVEGGGTLTGAAALTGADGVAAATGWFFGVEPRTVARATGTLVTGAGILGNGILFDAMRR